MKAGTERTVKTLVYLVIVGAAAFWAYGNVLPMFTRMLQKQEGSPDPNGGGTQPAKDAQTLAQQDILSSFAENLGTQATTVFDGLNKAINKIFSDLGTTATVLDPVFTVDPVKKAEVEFQQTLNAYSRVADWKGLTGYPATVYDPAAHDAYYESRQAANLHNI